MANKPETLRDRIEFRVTMLCKERHDLLVAHEYLLMRSFPGESLRQIETIADTIGREAQKLQEYLRETKA